MRLLKLTSIMAITLFSAIRAQEVESVEFSLNGGAFPESISIVAPTGYLYIDVKALDAQGNSLGPIRCIWTMTGNLPMKARDTSTSVYLTTNTCSTNAFGQITGTVLGAPMWKRTLKVTITVPNSVQHPPFNSRYSTEEGSQAGRGEKLWLSLLPPAILSSQRQVGGVHISVSGRAAGTHRPRDASRR